VRYIGEKPKNGKEDFFMKFQKAVSLVIFLAMAMLFFASPAQAIPLREAPISCADVVITPLWVNTDVARATISVSNLVLKPSAYIKAKSTSTGISGTLYLERKSGSNWITVKSWSISGTGTLTVSKSYTGTSGVTYRARVAVSVGGESIGCTSSTVNA